MHGGAAGSRRCQERCRDTGQSAECLNRVTATWPPLPAACPPPSPCRFSVTFSRSVDRGTVSLDLPIAPHLPVASLSVSPSLWITGTKRFDLPITPISLSLLCQWTPQGQMSVDTTRTESLGLLCTPRLPFGSLSWVIRTESLDFCSTGCVQLSVEAYVRHWAEPDIR